MEKHIIFFVTIVLVAAVSVVACLWAPWPAFWLVCKVCVGFILVCSVLYGICELWERRKKNLAWRKECPEDWAKYQSWRAQHNADEKAKARTEEIMRDVMGPR